MKKLAAILELSKSNPVILSCVCAIKTLEKFQNTIQEFFKEHKIDYLTHLLNDLTLVIREERNRIMKVLDFHSGKAITEQKTRGISPSGKKNLLEQAILAGFSKQEIELIEEFLHSARETKDCQGSDKYRINTNIRTIAEMTLKVPSSYTVNGYPQRSVESKHLPTPESPELPDRETKEERYL